MSEKNKYIKTADFEAAYSQLIKDITELERTPKTAILGLVKGFRNKCISYTPREEIEIPLFLEVR